MVGMAGGIIAADLKISILNKEDFKQYSDYAATGLWLGPVIGRIGYLAIVEHLGRQTDFFLGYEVKPGYDLAPQHNSLECAEPLITCGSFHHVAMYDLFLALGVFFIFRYFQQKFIFGKGAWIGLWAFWYGTQRAFLDTLRFGMGDATIGTLTWNQVGGTLLAILGIIFFFKNKNIRTN